MESTGRPAADTRTPRVRRLTRTGDPAQVDQQQRRARSFIIACVAFVLVTAAVAVMPAKYVINRPGSPYNVFASGRNGDVVKVSGATTYPVTGRLDMTTVNESVPQYHVTLFEAMLAWMSSHDMLIPYDVVYPQETSNAAAAEKGRVDMVDAEQSAIISAYKLLKIPYSIVPKIGRAHV